MSSSIPSPACRIAVISYSSRSSSRPRPVIISYRIPDDIETQSIICDTGYDDISFRHALSHRPPLLPAPLPAEPCRPTGRPKARRHPTRYSLATRLAAMPCLLSSSHLIGSSVPPVACLPRPTHAVAIHLIRPFPSHRLISRPAPLPAMLPAERPASPRSV